MRGARPFRSQSEAKEDLKSKRSIIRNEVGSTQKVGPEKLNALDSKSSIHSNVDELAGKEKRRTFKSSLIY